MKRLTIATHCSWRHRSRSDIGNVNIDLLLYIYLINKSVIKMLAFFFANPLLQL